MFQNRNPEEETLPKFIFSPPAPGNHSLKISQIANDLQLIFAVHDLVLYKRQCKELLTVTEALDFLIDLGSVSVQTKNDDFVFDRNDYLNAHCAVGRFAVRKVSNEVLNGLSANESCSFGCL